MFEVEAVDTKIAGVRSECNFCQSYIIRYKVILYSNVEWLWLITSQLETYDIHFGRITEVCQIRPISKENLRLSIWVSI